MTSRNEATVDIWTVQNAPESLKMTSGQVPDKMESVQNQVQNQVQKCTGLRVKGNLARMTEVCKPCPHFEEHHGVGGCVRNKGLQWTRLDLLDHCPKVIQFKRR